ncbi:SDR family oxidoreductase [Kocuria aegyptia]|uniref:SDR family oxidoreductase n=1 Tax=Kocuria aegyptia TaxID=330943 RepID=A0ABP4WLM2_9MICC
MRKPESVVVITGASSGIGRASALRFAGRDTSLVLAARRAEALETVAEECRRRGARAVAVPTDVTDPEAVQELARRAVEEFGRIDVWVNNAAVGFFSPFLDVPLEDFRRVLDVNVMGYVHGARAALPVMRRQGRGVLVNVSSVVAEIAQPYTSAYSMSKAAVRALGVSLRAELSLDGLDDVNVCTVLPASIDTPFFRHAANYTGRAVEPMVPVSDPRAVARAVVSVARRPRREVAVGAMSRSMVLEHRLAPGLMEAMMARQVDASHLSEEHTAADTAGNLHRPSPDPETAAVSGGWAGRRRTAQRRILAAGLLVAGPLVVRRLLR